MTPITTAGAAIIHIFSHKIKGNGPPISFYTFVDSAFSLIYLEPVYIFKEQIKVTLILNSLTGKRIFDTGNAESPILRTAFIQAEALIAF